MAQATLQEVKTIVSQVRAQIQKKDIASIRKEIYTRIKQLEGRA